MELVEAAVKTKLAVLVSFPLPVIAQHPGPFSHFWIRREQRPAVSEGTQVLGGVEARSCHRSHCPSRLPIPLRSCGLGAILDQSHFVLF